jgi:hypothetical protein
MTSYMNNRLIPGIRGNLRQYINRSYILQYNRIEYVDELLSSCSCIKDESKNKQGINITYRDESRNERLSRLIRNSNGGTVVFGNDNIPVKLNYMGGWDGQPGGTPRPLRNKF